MTAKFYYFEKIQMFYQLVITFPTRVHVGHCRVDSACAPGLRLGCRLWALRRADRLAAVHGGWGVGRGARRSGTSRRTGSHGPRWGPLCAPGTPPARPAQRRPPIGRSSKIFVVAAGRGALRTPPSQLHVSPSRHGLGSLCAAGLLRRRLWRRPCQVAGCGGGAAAAAGRRRGVGPSPGGGCWPSEAAVRRH